MSHEASEKMRADFEKMKTSEVEELTEAFKAVKAQMASELEANVETKGILESDLTSTKHSLLDVKHQLNMAEKVYTSIKSKSLNLPSNIDHILIEKVIMKYCCKIFFNS